MDSNQMTMDYFGRIALRQRLIGSDLPDLHTELFGVRFNTPVTTGALSHLDHMMPNGMMNLAENANRAGALCFVGMVEDEQIPPMVETGARIVRFVKPAKDNEFALRQIRAAREAGAFAVGCDLDHAYNSKGGYDDVQGLICGPKTIDELKAMVEAAGELPFIAKGILSTEDALAAKDAGAKGIVVSSHHGIMDSLVPPLRVLPEIRAAVGADMTIFLDSSVQTGTDVFKALALGANAVCVGRALISDLKKDPPNAIYNELCKINGQLASCMARTGYRTVADIDDRCIVMM